MKIVILDPSLEVVHVPLSGIFFLIFVIVTVVIALPIIFRFLTASGTRTTPDHKSIVSKTHKHTYHNFEDKYCFRLHSKWYVYHSLDFDLLWLLLL